MVCHNYTKQKAKRAKIHLHRQNWKYNAFEFKLIKFYMQYILHSLLSLLNKGPHPKTLRILHCDRFI